MKKLLNWFATKPATKAAWAAVFITLILNSYVIYQNSQTLNAANESILLSIDPSIEVEFTSDSAYVVNTTPAPIVDVRITPIVYKVQQKPFKILDRNHGGPYYILAQRLNSKERITIPMFHLVNDLGHPINDDPAVVRVAVITFRREIDSKVFADIEVFGAVTIEGRTALFPYFSGKNTGLGGSPYYLKRILDEIVAIEKTFFKAEHFQ